MTKVLIKKQLMELFSYFYQDRKKKKNRTGIKLVLWILLYLAIFGMLGSIFYGMSNMLCAPLVAADFAWLYFALTCLVCIALGIFGSVFNTFASLYQAKDNDLLFSMPIKPSKILNVRMIGVYAMGLLYEAVVIIPVIVKFFMVAGFKVSYVVGAIAVTFLISIFILSLSCILGGVVAFINSKTKQKNLVVVFISLAFIAGYYYVYGRAYSVIQDIAANPQRVSEMIKSKGFVLYHLGLAALGKPVSILIITAMVFAIFAVVYFALAKSYMKIITTSKGQSKVKNKTVEIKSGSVSSALFKKELNRFLGSANYMLNCGLGIILMPIAAVVLLIKGGAFVNQLNNVFVDNVGVISLLAVVFICTFSSMNDITAPSVSLEGNNIWILQVFPVTGWQALLAKLKLHLLLTLVPVIVLTVCVEILIKPTILFVILIPLVAIAFVVLMASLGLVLNLNIPNINWTNEIVPIKQGMSAMITLFGGWAILVVLSLLYYVLRNILTPEIYLVCVFAVIVIICVLLIYWLKTKGSKIFENLR